MGLGIAGRIGWMVLRARAPVACTPEFSSMLENGEGDLREVWYCSLARILAAARVIMVDDRIGLEELEDKEISNFCRATNIMLRRKD